MKKQKILIQIDSDPLASTFDSIVAIDSGVDQLITRAGVTAMEVQSLVHGAMFTRGGEDLKNTALFFGGSNVGQSESLVKAAKKTFFGPVRVSIMSDPNGSNTTSAAAVLCAKRHVELSGCNATVLAATGPVGQRIAALLFRAEANVTVCSRRLEKAKTVCDQIQSQEELPRLAQGQLIPYQTQTAHDALQAVQGARVVFAAGAASVQLLDASWLELDNPPEVAIDVNAVPPAGISGIGVTDKAAKLNSTFCYGAIGVGGLKMKIHRKCIQQLFESNDLVLEVDEIFALGQEFED